MPRLIPVLPALLVVAALSSSRADDFAVDLPPGVSAVWSPDAALRETTTTRERISINGLWRWQPAASAQAPAEPLPAGNWGYFKVPGCWPGITDYMQKDSQTLFAHPRWSSRRLADVAAAWYEREITIPRSWADRRITCSIEYLNSYAAVFLDGRPAGEVRFPGGTLDLTSACRPGATHRLTLYVVAQPLQAVLLSYRDTSAARQVEGRVARRGLCGDLFLSSEPRGPRIADIKIDPSFRRRELTIEAALENLAPSETYRLHAHVTAQGQPVTECDSPPFAASSLAAGRYRFTHAWLPDKLWDLHTPQHQYDLALTLQTAAGELLDAPHPQRFGFREFWIDGKDFYLNGSRIYLCAVPFDNAQIGAALANYAAAAESLRRLKAIGINFVYTHNYGCQPGDHLSFAEILRAADDVGVLVALSQPHFSHYDWQAADADQTNGYARHAEFYVRQAQNHPAVVAYSMSHNACGYGEDMNPDLIDGLHDPRSPGEMNNVRRALRAEALVKQFDPARIVYHHAGGNLGAMHTINFYPNFVPVQEMSDWFEHWATAGVKPAFTCEYGAPFAWDWAMYRGWYQGERSFGSARVPWDFCLAEWNAQFLGDRACQISEAEKANLRFEARQLAAGRVWYRWDYPFDLNSKVFDERYPIIADYLTRNWRAFRTWGVSAISPWEHGQYWKLREGVDRGRRELPVDWQRLQRPGFSPDYQAQRYERMDLAYEPGDWLPTPAAEALLRNNQPLLAYIAGRPGAFTSQDHTFYPGEVVEKQLIVINNARLPIDCDCRWTCDWPGGGTSQRRVKVPTGQQVQIPLRWTLPADLAPGSYHLRAQFQFSTGQTQADEFTLDVLARPRPAQMKSRVALWDPRGTTRAWLEARGVPFTSVGAADDLAPFDLLVIGQAAISVAGPAPDIARVRDGLRVLVLEQSAEALEKRLGFRTAQYGLRQVFQRVPDHPALAGLAAAHWHDWRGSATLLPPRLDYELRPRLGPTVEWCGLRVPRLWRCGNRGNVASVLIEKPACGDFLPLVDGGYSLQYSPLLEHRLGRGVVLFCQLDLSARTENEPAAETLLHNLLCYLDDWQPPPVRTAMYVGDPAARAHLESSGAALQPFAAEQLRFDHVLIVGPGGGQQLASQAQPLRRWWQAGGRLIVLGASADDLAPLPLSVEARRAEHIAAFFETQPLSSPCAGVGPADVHNRDPQELPLIAGGATALGNGVLAHAADGRAVFFQLTPWQWADSTQLNHRKTFRRSAFAATRLLANQGVPLHSPLPERFHTPVDPAGNERRWLAGLYLDQPQEWDDPYRFFRW